jgi:hypothetical protein
MQTRRCFIATLAATLGAGLAAAKPEPPPKETKGTITGKLIKKNGAIITVKDDQGKEMKLMPHWRGGLPKDGGGFDKGMVQRLEKFDEGDHVTVRWSFTEHHRIEAIDHTDKVKR